MCDHLDMKFRRRVAMTNRVKLNQIGQAHICIEHASPHGDYGAIISMRSSISIIALSISEVRDIEIRRRNRDLNAKINMQPQHWKPHATYQIK